MDTKRFDLLLKYILAAAGQEDPGHRELGPIHLIKYLYLADLIFAEKHRGETYTGAPWRFHHFGPWSPEVYSRIEPVLTEVGVRVRQIPSSKAEEFLKTAKKAKNKIIKDVLAVRDKGRDEHET